MTNTGTAVITAAVSNYTGQDLGGVTKAALVGEAAREFLVEPAASALCRETTTTYTDGSQTISDLAGSREHDPQGRLVAATDRFGGSMDVYYDEKGNGTAVVLDDDVPTVTCLSDDSGGDSGRGGGDCVVS